MRSVDVMQWVCCVNKHIRRLKGASNENENIQGN